MLYFLCHFSSDRTICIVFVIVIQRSASEIALCDIKDFCLFRLTLVRPKQCIALY